MILWEVGWWSGLVPSENRHLGQLVISAEGPMGGIPHRLVLVSLGNTPDSDSHALTEHLGDVVEAVIPRAGTAPR